MKDEELRSCLLGETVYWNEKNMLISTIRASILHGTNGFDSDHNSSKNFFAPLASLQSLWISDLAVKHGHRTLTSDGRAAGLLFVAAPCEHSEDDTVLRQLSQTQGATSRRELVKATVAPHSTSTPHLFEHSPCCVRGV